MCHVIRRILLNHNIRLKRSNGQEKLKALGLPWLLALGSAGILFSWVAQRAIKFQTLNCSALLQVLFTVLGTGAVLRKRGERRGEHYWKPRIFVTKRKREKNAVNPVTRSLSNIGITIFNKSEQGRLLCTCPRRKSVRRSISTDPPLA